MGDQCGAGAEADLRGGIASPVDAQPGVVEDGREALHRVDLQGESAIEPAVADVGERPERLPVPDRRGTRR